MVMMVIVVDVEEFRLIYLLNLNQASVSLLGR